MTVSLDRRQFLLGSSVLATAAALGISPAAAADVHLRLYWWGGQARADRTNAVSDLYAKANPGFTYDKDFNAFNDYWPKLGTQVAGGNAPDMFQMDYRYIVEYAKRGAILALDDYVGKELKLDDFDKDQIEGGKVDGKLYAHQPRRQLGRHRSSTTNAFEAAGVDLPDPRLDL